MAYIFDEHKGKQDFETVIKPKLDALKTTFQDNVNSMYNALVGKGKTPTAKTPAAISTAITNIFDDVYTKFVNQGTTPSAKTVSGMSNAVDTLATAKYNAGNTAGYNSGKTDGYNNGVAATKKGNAGTGDVLSGKTFTNSSSVNATGTMANKGAWGTTVNAGKSVNVPTGYHNGSGVVYGALGAMDVAYDDNGDVDIKGQASRSYTCVNGAYYIAIRRDGNRKFTFNGATLLLDEFITNSSKIGVYIFKATSTTVTAKNEMTDTSKSQYLRIAKLNFR